MSTQPPLPVALAWPSGLVIDLTARRAELRGQPLALIGVEYALLGVLAGRPGRAVAGTTLLDRVWGSAFVGDYHHLAATVERLRAKLGDAGGGCIAGDPARGHRLVGAREMHHDGELARRREGQVMPYGDSAERERMVGAEWPPR